MIFQHSFLILLGLVLILSACTSPTPTVAVIPAVPRSPTSSPSITNSVLVETQTPRASTQTIVRPTSTPSVQTDRLRTPITSVLSFPFAAALAKPKTVWVGDVIPSRTTEVINNDGEVESLNVSIAGVSPDGKYVIFVNPVQGYSVGPSIADLQNHSVKVIPKLDKNFYILSDSPNFVFSPDGDEFVATTLGGNKPGWDLVLMNANTGAPSIRLTDADFQNTAARIRDDETLIPLAWKANNVLLLKSVRPETDANFGILIWDRNRNTWQRIKTEGTHLSNAGRKIAFITHDVNFAGANQPGANVVKVFDTTSQTIITIASTTQPDHNFDFPLFNALAWSPDDRQLLFMGHGVDTSNGKTGLVLRLADLDSNSFQQIAVETDGLISDVRWTSNGIYYLASGTQTTWLKRIDPTQQNPELELLGRMVGERTKILKIWE